MPLEQGLAPQSVQVAPPSPQNADDGMRQTLPAQHPLAHDSESHTQAPATQCRPGAHAAPLPHVQPPLLQASAVSRLHAAQAPPPVPQ